MGALWYSTSVPRATRSRMVSALLASTACCSTMLYLRFRLSTSSAEVRARSSRPVCPLEAATSRHVKPVELD